MTPSRLDGILAANAEFEAKIDVSKLPLRRPESLAIITCMDPRINLDAVGIPPFSTEGEGFSDIRIIRTIGGMADMRSLLIGIFLAGIKEFVVLMHTDCGCCLAFHKIDTLIDNMQGRLEDGALDQFKAELGEPFRANLMGALKVFEEPRAALRQEIETLRAAPYIPDDIVWHGLLYHTATGRIEVVVDGYRKSHSG